MSPLHSASLMQVSHVPRSTPLTGGAMWQLQSGQNDTHSVTSGHVSVGVQLNSRLPSALQKLASLP